MPINDKNPVKTIDGMIGKALQRSGRTYAVSANQVFGTNSGNGSEGGWNDAEPTTVIVSDSEPAATGYEDGDIWVETDTGAIVGLFVLIDGYWVAVPGVKLQIDASGGTGTTYGALTGAINGANTTFTVSQGSYTSGTLKVWLNGLLQLQGSDGDYQETTPGNGTFDFLSAPPAGCWIIVEYEYQPN